MSTLHPFDDSLEDLIGSPMRPLPVIPPHMLAAVEPILFTEPCPDCHGSGRWGSFGNRRCFKCNGTGKKTFKSSPEHRAKAKARKGRILTEKLDAFKAEFPHIWEWLEKSTKFEFAVSLRTNLLKWGSLTDGQIAAAERCIANFEAAKARNAEHKANAPTVSTTKLEEAFAKAGAKAARPGQVGVWVRPISMKSGDVALKFSNGTNAWAGMIFVKTPENKKVGHIKNGKFVRKFVCTDAEEAAVLDCCNDPEKAAIAFGKAFGVCSICHRTLTNDESIERGIGPICAEKFGW